MYDMPMDLLVAFDASNSIGERQFWSVTHFIAAMLDYYELGPTAVQIGVVQFASHARPEVSFAEAAKMSKAELENHIRNIEKLHGITRIEEVLRRARLEYFTPAWGARPHTYDVLLLITDGDGDVDPLEEAKLVREAGIHIMTLGVGSLHINIPQLYAMADNQDFVFIVPHYDQLNDTLWHLIHKAKCTGLPSGMHAHANNLHV